MEVAFDTVDVGDVTVVIYLHTDKDPSPEEWQQTFQKLEKVKAKIGGIDNMRILAISDGGSPSLAVRQRFSKEFPAPLAAVTVELTSAIKRGVATAVQWVLPRVVFCQPKDYERALAHLGISGQLPRLWPTLKRMQQGLTPVQALEYMGRRAGLSL